MKKKVIICCPNIKKTGGVANFYRIFNEKQTINASLFFNNNIGGKNYVLMIAGYIWQYITFFLKIWRYDTLVINPSMSGVCLLRDSLYIRIARLFCLKVIVFWRGFNDEYFDNTVIKRYAGLMIRTFFKANHTIVLGKTIYEKLHSIGLNTPYSIMTTIVSEDFILKEPRNFDYENLTILFLARIQPSKGIYETIDTFSLLNKRFPTLKLKVCGDGDILQDVKAYATEKGLKDLEFMGNVSGASKKDAYLQSDMYLFPSYYEGMPNSVLEAMGMGMPVICSAVGGLPDFFQQGEMGTMIKKVDVSKLSEAISTLIEQKKLSTISEFNIKYAKENFLDRIVVKRLENVIANV